MQLNDATPGECVRKRRCVIDILHSDEPINRNYAQGAIDRVVDSGGPQKPRKCGLLHK